jgi:hypothetical protein
MGRTVRLFLIYFDIFNIKIIYFNTFADLTVLLLLLSSLTCGGLPHLSPSH